MKALLILLGIGGALFFLARPAAGSSQSYYVPTENDILGAGSWEELDTYFELINELKVSGVIDTAEYNTLYSAYEARYNELAGVI